MSGMNCNYCKAINKDKSFMIGAGSESEWVLHEGTGKISCPKCYPLGIDEAIKIIDTWK